MADDNKVLFELGLDRQAWNADASAILSSAGDIDAALKGLVDQAGQVGKALGGLGSAAVKVTVDTSEIGTAAQSLADLAGSDANVHILADDGDLDTALDKVEDIDAAAPDVKVSASDTELDTAKKKVDDIDGETASVDVKADTSDADTGMERVQGQLQQLNQLAVIDLVMNATGPGLDLLERALDLVTSTDEAVRTLAARTGQDIPNAAAIIDDLYTNNWGESKAQIAEVLALSLQLGVEQENLAAATQSAFQVASVTGEDVNEILRTQNQIVKTGLAGSYQEAADLITAGFQTGANRGDDLLDTFNEYSSKFREFGINGQEALAIINAGLDNGFENSDKVADVINELYIRVTDLGDAAAQASLNELGITIPADSGDFMGAEIMQQIIDGIQAAAPQRQQELTRSLFGTIAEDKGLYAVMGLEDYSAVEESFDIIDGRAQQSADIINDTLGGAINTLFRTVEVEAQDFLSSDQINLDQKIDDIKNGITTAVGALKDGEGLAEALEIGLQLPGFADSVHRFEASIGEFGIGILELIAGVQEFLGRDSSGTRQEIGRLAESQLAYNLKVANPDEIAGEINRAVARGVDTEGLQTAIGTSIGELIASGDLEQAQTLIDQIGDSSIRAADGLDDYGQSLANDALNLIKTVSDPARIEQIIAPYRDAGILQGTTLFDATQFQDEIDVAVKATQAAFDAAVASGDIGLAAKLADDLGQGGALLSNAFVEAMSGGNFGTAEAIAGQFFNSDAMVAQVRAAAHEARVAAFGDAGGAAFLEGDTAVAAEKTADAIFPKEAATMLDAMRSEQIVHTEAFVADMEANHGRAGQASEDFAATYDENGKRIISTQSQMTNQTNILKGAMLGLLGEVGPGILDLANNLQNIASGATLAAQTIGAATAVAGAANGAGGNVPEFAGGGQPEGFFSAGEQGQEFIFADERVAVLNNQSTEAIMNAVRSVAGYVGIPTGGGGGGSVVNMYNTFYTPSVATSVSASQQIASSIRGQG